jgi:hypothetical protein
VTTCTKLMQLFSSMSSPSFLLANESNHDLLKSLLDALNAIIEHQYKSRYLAPKLYGSQLTSHRQPDLHILTLEEQEALRGTALFHAGEWTGGA